MQNYTASIILALALTSCRTAQNELGRAAQGFSFSNCAPPSLMDINGGKFVEPLEGKLYRLTNVHPSFDRSFTMIHNEAKDVYFIQDKRGRTLFEGHFDGVSRYVACVDIDGDNGEDVIVELAAYGTHGNVTESIDLLQNENGKLIPLGNLIEEKSIEGQEYRAGMITW